MRPRVVGGSGERGETLLEIVLAVMVLGIGSAALLPAMGMSITTSRLHHDQTVAGRVLDNFAEHLKDEATSPYVPCATSAPTTAAAYDTYTAGFLALANDPTSTVHEPAIGQYTLSVRVDAGVPNPVLGAEPATSWPALTSPAACSSGPAPYDTAATDDRIQRLTLTVMRNGSSAGATVQITKWRRS